MKEQRKLRHFDITKERTKTEDRERERNRARNICRKCETGGVLVQKTKEGMAWSQAALCGSLCCPPAATFTQSARVPMLYSPCLCMCVCACVSAFVSLNVYVCKSHAACGCLENAYALPRGLRVHFWVSVAFALSLPKTRCDS